MDPAPLESSVEPPEANTAIKPLDITFGVEFEFILIESFPEGEDRLEESNENKIDHGLSQVGNVLRNTQFTCESCGGQFPMSIGVQDAWKDWKPDHSQGTW